MRKQKKALTKKRRYVRKQKKTQKRQKRIKGGNYETDITTRTTLGEPTKALNKITATRAGYPVMSGTSLFKIEEQIDQQGDDAYD